VKSRKNVPFGVIKLKFNCKPLFIPKTVKFWPKTGRSFFSTENAEQWGHSTFIIIIISHLLHENKSQVLTIQMADMQMEQAMQKL